jgi:hypothetical protein
MFGTRQLCAVDYYTDTMTNNNLGLQVGGQTFIWDGTAPWPPVEPPLLHEALCGCL